MKRFRGPLKKILAVLRSFSFLGVWAYALFAPAESSSNLTFSCLLILPALFHSLYTLLFVSCSHFRRQTAFAWGVALVFGLPVCICLGPRVQPPLLSLIHLRLRPSRS